MPLSTIPIDGLVGTLLFISVEFGQDHLNSSNGSVAIFHPSRRHNSLVQLQICPDAHQPEIVCNVETDHLDEIFERLFAYVIENDSQRQRLVELQALAGLCETANIYPLRLFQPAHRSNSPCLRRFNQSSRLQPARKPSLQREHILIAHLLEIIRSQGTSVSACAIHQNWTRTVGSDLEDLLLQDASTDMLRAADMALDEFVFLTYIDDQRKLFKLRQRFGCNFSNSASSVVCQLDECIAMVRGHIFSSIPPEQKWGEFIKQLQKRDHVKPYHIDITYKNVKRRSAKPESRGIEKTGTSQSQIDLVGLLVQKGEMTIREPAGFPEWLIVSCDFAAVFLHHCFLS